MDNAERAAQLGIQTQYWDARGQHRTADSEALDRMIEALSLNGAGPRHLIRQTCAVRDHRERQVRLEAAPGCEIAWTITGDRHSLSGTGQSPLLAVPDDLPVGSYRLRVTARSPEGERSEDATLLVAPERAYQGDENAPRRVWAVAVQLYSVRSRRNWGHGDFTDLAALIDLAGDLGAAGIGLNPLHALFDDEADASPYSPNSRLFLNPRYIDVEAIPEFPGLREAGLDAEVEALRQQEFIDYRGVVAAKLKGLRVAFEAFRRSADRSRQHALEAFRRNRAPALTQFACFEGLRGHYRQPWWEWPTEWRRPNVHFLRMLRKSNEDEIAYHEFVQWIADQQLLQCRERAKQRGLPIGLYLDVAVGVRADGFDAWSEQDSILSTVEIGAPPDMLNTAGQKWGLAGVSPVGLEARGFESFRNVLRAAMRYAGAIRLDHVMGLQRQFLIPSGMKPDRGMYVRSSLDAMLAVTAQESVANKCIVIGEDLGTVLDGFRETLADWGLWSYQVMLFERGWKSAFRKPEEYRENAIATFATHDLPTFLGWLESRDLAVKRALGLDPGETDEQRESALAALRHALSERGVQTLDLASVTAYLAATPTRLLVVTMEDALGLVEQVNVPGTVNEHPNWRRRLPVSLEDMMQASALPALAAVMSGAGRRVG